MKYKPICTHTSIDKFKRYLLDAHKAGHVGRQTIGQLRDSGNIVTQESANQVFQLLRMGR